MEAAVDTMLKAFGPEKINLFIDNEWYIINSIYYNFLGYQPDYSKMDLSQKELEKAEKVRRSEFLKRMVIPALERARWLAAKFPSKIIEEKITPEWLMKKGEENRPVIAEVVKARGEKGRLWLERQCAEFILFFTGRLIWSNEHRRLIMVVPTPESTGNPAETI